MSSESVRLEQLAGILVDPDHPEEVLTFEGNAFCNARTGHCYPVRPEGFVDFVTQDEVPAASPPAASRGGLLFRLNEYYNQHLEQRIARSIFAGGGIAWRSMDQRIRAWLAPIEGLVVDVGCGDRKAEALVNSNSRYFGVEYLTVTQFSPWRTSFPDINADALRLPLRSESVDCVLNMFVLEHVTSPERLVAEICRVVRPGGIVVIAGPGDILMSHGEPYVFFNMTRFAYRMLLEKNGFVIEEEYFPARFWVSITAVLYNYFVRNDFYNGGPVRKLLQLAMLGLSFLVSPVVNAIALVLDTLLPFDRRGYSGYVVRARKSITRAVTGAT